jgi:hypothetical protein
MGSGGIKAHRPDSEKFLRRFFQKAAAFLERIQAYPAMN